MRRRSLIALVAVTALIWLPTADSAVQPTFVECGDPVPSSIVLANSLFNCPGHGLDVTGNNVTIDLAGHTVDGDGIASDTEAGIAASTGPSNITVKNGVITGFQNGISMPDATGVTLKSIIVSDNSTDGIDLPDGTNHEIRNVISRRNGQSGFDLTGGTNHEVLRAEAFDNSFGFSLGGASSSYNVSRSTATHNSTYGFFLEGGISHKLDRIRASDNEGEGVHLHGTGHRITRSVLSGNDGDGVDVASGTNRIDTSSMSNNTASGINVLEGDRTVMSELKVFGNGLNGITLDDFAGISAVSMNQRVLESSLYGNGSSGIYLGDGENYVVSETSSHGNRFEGFFLQNGDGHRLTISKAVANGQDGVELNSGTNYTVRRVTANRNGFANGVADGLGLGIFVAGGVTGLDAAKNKASGNDGATPGDSSTECSAAANCNV